MEIQRENIVGLFFTGRYRRKEGRTERRKETGGLIASNQRKLFLEIGSLGSQGGYCFGVREVCRCVAAAPTAAVQYIIPQPLVCPPARPFWFPMRIVLICCVVCNSDGVLCAEGLLLLAASITSQTAWRIPVMSTYTTLGTLQIPTLRCRYLLCLVFYPILFMLYIMFSGTLNWSNICYNIYIIYFI